MFPEQHQRWSLVSPFPAEKNVIHRAWAQDHKPSCILSHWSMANILFLSREKLPSGQGKKYPHLILAVPYTFYESEECKKLASVRICYLTFRTAFFSSPFRKSFLPCLHLFLPPTHTHTGRNRFFCSYSTGKSYLQRKSSFFLLGSVTVFRCFRQLLDGRILVFFIIQNAICLCENTQTTSIIQAHREVLGHGLYVTFRSWLLLNSFHILNM